MKRENSIRIKRRDFVKRTGTLVIGIPFLSQCIGESESAPLVSPTKPRVFDQANINAWLEIMADGMVNVYTGKMELGQGISVAVTQVAAEELVTDIGKITINLAETEVTPNEGYTVGSNSTESTVNSIRYAAASARAKIIELAGNKLGVPVEDLYLENGVVHSKDKKQLVIKEVLEDNMFLQEVDFNASLIPETERKYIGKIIPRFDVEKMATGKSLFLHDLRFENMVHARIVRPPSINSILIAVDKGGFEQNFPNVTLISRGSFLGVVAADEYEAIKACSFLKENTGWKKDKPIQELSDLKGYLKSLPARTEQVLDSKIDGNNSSDIIVEAEYVKPYLIHGSIGPSIALAEFKDEKLSIWSHSQGIYPLRSAISDLVGLPEDNVHIKGVPGSGCYGHNGADDAAGDAAILAMAVPGKTIRLQWSREDEHGWEPFGSAMICSLKASIDNNGKIQTWESDLWSDTHVARPRGDAAGLICARFLEKPKLPGQPGWLGGTYRNAEPYYDISQVKIGVNDVRGNLRTSALRSLGAYANLFALESFMDELAQKTNQDPVEFRINHCKDQRSKEVIMKVVAMVKRDKLDIKAEEGIGYAFSRYENSKSYCAVAIHLGVEASGKVKLKKAWSAIDAGEAINPDGIKNQTEGGIIQSASWTLYEQVQTGEHHVSSLDWASYPIIRFMDVPKVEVEIIDRPGMPSVGAGEAAQGPAAAAILNAIFAATGKRIRELPVGSKLA